MLLPRGVGLRIDAIGLQVEFPGKWIERHGVGAAQMVVSNVANEIGDLCYWESYEAGEGVNVRIFTALSREELRRLFLGG